MNKYFLVRPSCFWKYDVVDIEGNYPHVAVEDFNISENNTIQSAFNFLIFEVPCKESNGKFKYSNEAKELVTNTKFALSIDEKEEEMVNLYSDSLGLYLINPLRLVDIECKPSKVSGLVNYLNENEEVSSNYNNSLESLVESSRFYKELYDETIHGPSKASVRGLRKNFFRG